MNVPLFPLDLVLFPGEALPLHIFEERYKEMIVECLAARRPFGVVRAEPEGMATIGCMAAIVRVLERYPDGRLDILCQGAQRFEIETLNNSRAFLQAEVDFFEDDGPAAARDRREKCAALHFEVQELLGVAQPGSPDLNLPVSFALAPSVPSDIGFKQELLALRSDADRTERMIDFYNRALPKLRRGVMATKAAGRNGHVM